MSAPDDYSSAALIQGALVGLVMRYLVPDDSPIRVNHVEQETGEDGIYLPYFTVVMGSGRRVKVSVEDTDPEGK